MTERTQDVGTLVFLVDVDNTLLNNDQLKADITAQLEEKLGPQKAARFWTLYEDVRSDEDYVDFPRTVQLLAEEYRDPAMGAGLNRLLRTLPFQRYLYPQVLETIKYLETIGTVVILSDGDTVFQPLKIRDSGLEAAVDGHVLIFVHKEDELSTVFAAYPADHYVMVDDKPRILAALERCCPTAFTTILVAQGKYAHDQVSPRPDYVVEHIADLLTFTRPQFFSTAGSSRRG